ncbi:hypothetical protein [Photobacterium leiognathi]|uniref:hypothetical protein n=1 Tax=Photobacterium leiognathi TaxID=553611 RepID=UPI002739848C|nr:hypothetical protein [Photobacterium leiognathi]
MDGILLANHGVNEAKKGAVVISLQVEETPTLCSHSFKGKKYLLANTDTFDPNYDQIVAGSYRAMNQNLKVTAAVNQNCQIITISFDR